MMRQHHQETGEIQRKLNRQQAALEALPPGLQDAALVEDRRPFPIHRRMPTVTPPIEGYATEDIGAEDLRE